MQAAAMQVPPIGGEILFDEATRAAAATDFGHIVHRMPLCVVRPASEDDVAATLRWAAQRQYPVAAQGRRHSVFGRASVERGVVLDMSSLRAVHRIESDRVVVDAGATWQDVLAATLPRQLVPPALPDYLGLSVGGTLSVGGVGAFISRFGVVSDNVLDMQVVTGQGERIGCSPDRNAALFDAVRAGLGQVGVVTRATLRLVPAPAQVRRFQLIYADLGTLLRDERLLAADDRFDAVQGAIVATPAGWSFRLDAIKAFGAHAPDDDRLLAGLSDDRPQAKPGTLPHLEYLGRLGVLEQALRGNGQWSLPHPWLTTFVGDSRVEAAVSGELARLAPQDLGPFGQVSLSAFRRRTVRTPLLRLPPDALCCAFNLIRIPDTGDAEFMARLVDCNRAAYERIRGAGGTLYPVSACSMSRGDWQAHFAESHAAQRSARQQFDPAHRLAPGYEVF